jgi:glycosyltransferase involved in cell wall biosynthesis
VSKISVIVPVYNKEKLLPRLLDSLLAQTYGDMEFILVDDGSTDGSAAIIDRYAEKDARIMAIHKENGGVVSARNTGLDRMTGEFFGFVDGDDYVEPDMFEKLHAAMVEEDCDMAECGFRLVSSEGAEIEVRHARHRRLVLTSEESVAGLRSSGGKRGVVSRMRDKDKFLVSGVVWDKLYKAKVFGDLRFDPFTKGMADDTLYMVEALRRTQGMCLIGDVGYNFVDDEASLTRAAERDLRAALEKQRHRLKVTVLVSDRYIETLRGIDRGLANDAACTQIVLYAHSYLGAVNMVRRSNGSDANEMSAIADHIREQMAAIIADFRVYLPERVLCFLVTHFPRLAEAALGAAWKMRG